MRRGACLVIRFGEGDPTHACPRHRTDASPARAHCGHYPLWSASSLSLSSLHSPVRPARSRPHTVLARRSAALCTHDSRPGRHQHGPGRQQKPQPRRGFVAGARSIGAERRRARRGDAPRPGRSDGRAGQQRPAGRRCCNACVAEFDAQGTPVWSYSRRDDPALESPVLAARRGKATRSIVDSRAARVFIVNPAKQLIWQYGTTGEPGSGVDQLVAPSSAEVLGDGNVLVLTEAAIAFSRCAPPTMRRVLPTMATAQAA